MHLLGLLFPEMSKFLVFLISCRCLTIFSSLTVFCGATFEESSHIPVILSRDDSKSLFTKLKSVLIIACVLWVFENYPKTQRTWDAHNARQRQHTETATAQHHPKTNARMLLCAWSISVWSEDPLSLRAVRLPECWISVLRSILAAQGG